MWLQMNIWKENDFWTDKSWRFVVHIITIIKQICQIEAESMVQKKTIHKNGMEWKMKIERTKNRHTQDS